MGNGLAVRHKGEWKTDHLNAKIFNVRLERGDAAKAYLVGKLPAERVLLTASKIGADGLPAEDKGPTTRVQFAIK